MFVQSCSFTVLCIAQMAVSKRSLALGREHAAALPGLSAARSWHSPVAQWRVEHGFTEAPNPDHACPDRCAFVNVVDNVYLCESCGRQHVCDEQCKERVMDTANGMPVCPISGMCFDQLDATWEVCSSSAITSALKYGPFNSHHAWLASMLVVWQHEAQSGMLIIKAEPAGLALLHKVCRKGKQASEICCWLQDDSDGGKVDDVLEWGDEGLSLAGGS